MTIKEADIPKYMQAIVAMGAHLLHVQPSARSEIQLRVHIGPASPGIQDNHWFISLEFRGFTIRKTDESFSDALEALASDLVTRVHTQMTEASEVMELAFGRGKAVTP